MDITVLNITSLSPTDVAQWTSAHLLDLRIPYTSPAQTYDVGRDILPLLASMSNRLTLATELYNVVTAEIVNARKAKRIGKELGTLAATVEYLESLNAVQEILYRTTQCLTENKHSVAKFTSGFDSNWRTR